VAWFLDTNTVIFCLRGRSASAMRQLHAVPATDVRIALQVHAERLVGAAKSTNPTQAKARVLAFLAPFALVWPDAAVAACRKKITPGGGCPVFSVVPFRTGSSRAAFLNQRCAASRRIGPHRWNGLPARLGRQLADPERARLVAG
jgi:hypothetical protein